MIQALFVIAIVITIGVYGHKLAEHTMHRISSWHSAKQAHVYYSRLVPERDRRVRERPALHRQWRVNQISSVWEPRIEHQRKSAAKAALKANNAFLGTGLRGLLGLRADPHKAGAKMIRAESGIQHMIHSFKKELGYVDRFLGSSRVHHGTGESLGGIRRHGHGPAIYKGGNK